MQLQYSTGSSASWQNNLRSLHNAACEVIATSPFRDSTRLLFSVHFDPMAELSGEWKNFPRLSLSIPKILYRERNDKSEIFLTASRSQETKSLAARWHRFIHAQSVMPVREPRPQKLTAFLHDEEYASTIQNVQKIVRSNHAGKIVAARKVDISAPHVMYVPHIIANLVREQPNACVYAFRPVAGQTFVSASPEFLARVEHGHFTTTAIAGTSAIGANSSEEEWNRLKLLSSEKEKREHFFVRDMILAQAEKFCTNVTAGSTHVLRLKDVQHLVTKISGQVANGNGLLDAVRLLHPTPAVAGTPRESAMKAIRRIENFPRGLYAGVAGWMDINGNGEAAVLIRSGVVSGRTARLYSGAGIVSESDVASESAETEAKLQTMIQAIANA